MKAKLIGAIVLCLVLGAPMSAHRLDEYLQATILSVEKDRVQASMRLIPGVAVSSTVIASIDTDGDGVISEAEKWAYAERVLGDLALSVDGIRLRPKLVSVDAPQVQQMKDGLGEIHIEFTADLPRGGTKRTLLFENHHESRSAAYLMNCLVPRDRDIRIVAQHRNEQQSFYQVDYVQVDASFVSSGDEWWRSVHRWTSAVGFTSVFRLGMRHIAEGTDHLLFLLALLLPAPLLAVGSRWGAFAGVGRSFVRILKIVTAFTAGHSITLALAALGLVRVPSRPIEVLIAVSVLVSAIHALRPLFPGNEPGIAAFFGLIHGLAFATTLGQLGLGRWERVGGILAFNLGIETMQLMVVAAILPSLILLSRTNVYSVLRLGGALFAGFASVGWIAERLFGVQSPVNVVVNSVAHHAVWVAAVLLLIGLAGWSLTDVLEQTAVSEPLSPPGLTGM